MYPNMSQEIARHRYADTLRDARAVQHRAWLAAEREPVDRLEPLRSAVGRLPSQPGAGPAPRRARVAPLEPLRSAVGRLGERLHVRHRTIRPAARPVC